MTARPRHAITWTFVTATLARPTGGDIALFEIVNAIARRGRDRVQLVHVPFIDARVSALADLPWFDFDPAVEHQFATTLDPDRLPDADVVVYTMKLLATALSPGAGAVGERLVDALQDAPRRSWLPILFLQGHGVFAVEVEELALRLPGPKVCVGTWLVDLLVRQGVLASDVVHIPNGVDPGTFRITRPIRDRPPRVAMNFDPHPVKGGHAGIDAIEMVHRQLGVPGTVFGTSAPERLLPAGVRFELCPSQATIAEDIYNGSSAFLQPSRREGFGMCAVEAMACGCALVTTANGGSADYAHDGETAIVCGPEAAEMSEAVTRLARDDALRIRIATNGAQFVDRFRWSSSAERLEHLASERLSDPDGAAGQ